MRNGGEGRARLLLIILIVTSLFLITLDLRGVKVLDGVRSGTQNVLAPFQKAGSTAISPFRNFIGDITNLGRTSDQIEKLKQSNAKLRARLAQRKNADAELAQLKSVLDLAGQAGYKVVAARVISQGSSTNFSQTVTIDIGTSSGVRQNMTVLSGEGLVGVVKESYANSALVMLATDPDFKVGVRIAGSQQIGILSGGGSKRASLQLLDNQNVVKVGDVLFFNPRVWHKAGYNNTDKTRYAITAYVTRPFIKQRFDFPKMVDQSYLKGLSPRIVNLLGVNACPPESVAKYYTPRDERIDDNY